jgi:hypothetical protein
MARPLLGEADEPCHAVEDVPTEVAAVGPVADHRSGELRHPEVAHVRRPDANQKQVPHDEMKATATWSPSAPDPHTVRCNRTRRDIRAAAPQDNTVSDSIALSELDVMCRSKANTPRNDTERVDIAESNGATTAVRVLSERCMIVRITPARDAGEH